MRPLFLKIRKTIVLLRRRRDIITKSDDTAAISIKRKIAYNNLIMRIDKYLKISRLIKRRTVAHDACEEGRVTVNDKTAKAGTDVRPGDIVCIRFGNAELKLRVVSTPEHAGREDSASLYETL